MSGGPDTGRGDFAVLLRRLREARSVTQEELAGSSGVTAKAISALERGERRRPYPHTVRSLADGLGLTDDERAALVAAVPRRATPSTGGATTSGSATAPAGTDPPPPPRPVAPPPAPAAPLVGREADVAAVLDLVTTGARLVTLTGAGGVGKTRLAREVLARAAPAFPDGTGFADLAPVREPTAVLPRLATALGLSEPPGGVSTASLAAALHDRRLLVVLDNLEQVLAAAPAVADLVERCPDLVVLATSRAPLRVRAEREMPLAPLGTPAGDGAEEVAASPAVRLLLDRAAAAGASLPLTPDTAPLLAAVTRRLDGIPLAVELAAASARFLTPAALLARLDRHGLDAASGAPRDLPDRQRTMTAVLDASADLLDPDDAALLGRLAVFAGGFSLDSAEAVADDPGGADVVGGIGALVEQSLLVPVPAPDDVPRFRLLEPVRQYAAVRLRDAEAALSTATAHADHLLDLGTAAHRRLQTARIGPPLDRLEADHANLRSAFLRLLELDRPDDAARLAGGVWLYLGLRGRAREGLDWLGRLPGGESDVGVAWAAVARMGLRLVVGDVAGLRQEAAVGVPVAARCGDPVLASEASVLAGLGAVFAGDLAAADDLLTLHPGLHAADAPWAQILRDFGRGQLALVAGDAPRAARLLDASLAAARDLGNEFTVATALNVRASAAEILGDDVRAAVLLGEALELSVRLRLGWTLGYAVPQLAGVAARSGHPVVAATLFGAAATLTVSDAVDAHFPPTRVTTDRGLAAAREALDERAFAQAWEAGRSATPAGVAELAARVVADVTRRGPA
ncbi:ATP-binding protein [Phycicoccus flavus]|uniref:XRE family transcriptional regulator n=1 Tax=Phycicoccus flavus TaxID=2502783 RepID=A0A8T6QYC6_9MICO|nr:helix-turn-helix domain-containing protein [Phycicoccus flavus]NHA66828.1 XRE family transcriptional regulator [Phycicoccus flavus]